MMRGHWLVVVLVTLAGLLGACGGSDRASAPSSKSTTTTAAYDGSTYARQVQGAVLDGFGVGSFAQACPQPDWVCAIGEIASPRPGQIEVTLQPQWDQVLTDANWRGGPAGPGCTKWNQVISRNVTNFTRAAKVDPPRGVSVFKPDGTPC